MNDNCGVYKITSPSGKIYIGESSNIKNRKYSYRTGRCEKQIKIHLSILKYGWELHSFEVLEICSREDLKKIERYWQDFYDSTGVNGLNCQLTGTNELKGRLSDDAKKKISEFNKGKIITQKHRDAISKFNKGKKLSNEHKEKIGNASRGKYVSEETKQKLRDINTGKNKSKETLEKMSLAMKKWHSVNKNPMEGRKGCLSAVSKVVIDLNTGVFYFGAKEASEYFNINYSYLKSMLNGNDKNKTSLRYC